MWYLKIGHNSPWTDYTGQQNVNFFVPRTSIDEPSSTCYVEFRCAYRNFLSGGVSKIKRNLNVQNSTLRAHETGRNFPLKCRGLWISSVFGVRYIPLQSVATVFQHTWGPLALAPLFHSHNILVKSFTVFVTDFAEIFWEKYSSVTPESGFSAHVTFHSFVRSQQVLHNIPIVRCFVIS